eukprot:7604553-Pyramimonas_sp.AAC.1
MSPNLVYDRNRRSRAAKIQTLQTRSYYNIRHNNTLSGYSLTPSGQTPAYGQESSIMPSPPTAHRFEDEPNNGCPHTACTPSPGAAGGSNWACLT